MNVGLIDVDGKGVYPNLALMKIARYHRNRGDNVEWCDYISHYDVVYKAKVFSFTPDDLYAINADKVVTGGTGYDLHTQLPQEIDRLQPDYSIYPNIDNHTAYGFLTRGCPNKCPWCVVPRKEGKIRPYMDVDEIAIEGRTNLVLMDNNILAIDYGIQQIEKIISRGYRVDFNQALDARLVTDDIARLLAQVRWLKSRIRFGCDTQKQIGECERAMALINKYGFHGEYFLYTMLNDDFNESFSRVNHWRKRLVEARKNKTNVPYPYAQPYRNPDKRNNPPQWQKDIANWTNKKQIFWLTEFENFEPRKGFKCKEYFKTKNL